MRQREFLQILMEAVAVLVDSEVRVEGEIEALLGTQHRLTGPRRDTDTLPADQHVVSRQPHREPLLVSARSA